MIGWNPNFSMEIRCKNKSHVKYLERIHRQRILDDNITRVSYYMLRDYSVFTPDRVGRIDLAYRESAFCEFLTNIDPKGLHRDKIEKKYRIWFIPKKTWCKDGALNGDVKSYRDFTIIGGKKDSKVSAVVFPNYHWIVNPNIGHQFYIEIHDRENTDIVSKFMDFISDLQKKLISRRLRPLFIVFDDVSKKYKTIPYSKARHGEDYK